MSSSSNPKNRKRHFKGAGVGGGSTAKKGRRSKLEPGMRGFLATCSNHDEPKCVREIYNLLNEYADRMIGAEKRNFSEKAENEKDTKTDQITASSAVDGKSTSNVEEKSQDDTDNSDSHDLESKSEKDGLALETQKMLKQDKPSKTDQNDDEDDLEAALKKECDALTGRADDNGEPNSSQATNQKWAQRRFVSMDTGVGNNIFIAANAPELDLAGLVQSILTDIKETGKCQSRFIQRLLPVEMTCKAYNDDIQRTFISNEDLLKKHFASMTTSDSDPPSYAVIYKKRNNSHVERDDVYKMVADIIQAINPLVKVDLEKPKKAITIDILQTVACIGIVDNYADLAKYNLHMVGKGKEEN